MHITYHPGMTTYPQNKRSVVVIGAGVAGLAAAWALHQKGFAIRVLDARTNVAQGASFANGAQLSYSHVQPLADPSVWRQLPSLLFSKSSPFAWRFSWSPAQWQWLALFALACRKSVSAQTTQQLLALGQESRQAIESMLEQTGIDCLHTQAGKLVLYPTPKALSAAQQQMAFQVQMGCEQHVLSAAEAVQVEPALLHYQSRIAGAVFTPSESVADCHLLCQHLKQWLEGQGVVFEMGQTAQRLLVSGGQVTGVQKSTGDVRADHYVLAAGAESPALLATAFPLTRSAVPVYPLKGYSVTLDVKNCQHDAPSVSVTDASRKLVFARLGSRLRVAGFAEICGHDTTVNPKRIEQMLLAVREIFPNVETEGHVQPWMGHRPATPTSRPIVGRLRGGPHNLWMHTGHGMLGFTLGFGTAKALASQLHEQE